MTWVMMIPWIKAKRELTAYRLMSQRRILAISSKLIPLPPETLLINPLNSSVVAFPKILGPMMEKMVLPTANITTNNTANL